MSNLAAIDDSINIAARLEALCRPYGVPLVISEEPASHAEAGLSSFVGHQAPVRGGEEPVIVYAATNASRIADSIAPDRRHDETSDAPVV